MDKYETYIIDPNDLFREGLKQLFSDTAFSVIGESRNLREFLESADKIEENAVMLLDYAIGQLKFQDDLFEMRARFPGARIVVLSSSDHQADFAACTAADVDGYLLKQISSEVLIESLRLITLGERVFPAMIASWMKDSYREAALFSPNEERDVRLTPREHEVLHALAEGLPNKLIARRLGISDATVKVHMKNILRKTQASNRTQAAIWAINNGLLGNADVESSMKEVAEEKSNGAAPATGIVT